MACKLHASSMLSAFFGGEGVLGVYNPLLELPETCLVVFLCLIQRINRFKLFESARCDIWLAIFFYDRLRVQGRNCRWRGRSFPSLRLLFFSLLFEMRQCLLPFRSLLSSVCLNLRDLFLIVFFAEGCAVFRKGGKLAFLVVV